MSCAVYVRCLEIRTDEREKGLNKLLLTVETSGLGRPSDGVISSSGDIKTCKKVWQTSSLAQGQDNLIITLKKRCIFSANKPLAKCVLPLSWFPTNKIVRDWFPLQPSDAGDEFYANTYVLMDVHVENRGVKRFMTEFSNLRVIPSWPRPEGADTDFPAPPQVMVVVPFYSPSSTPGYIAVGVSQYPTYQQIQQQSGIKLAQLKQVVGEDGVPAVLQAMPSPETIQPGPITAPEMIPNYPEVAA